MDPRAGPLLNHHRALPDPHQGIHDLARVIEVTLPKVNFLAGLGPQGGRNAVGAHVIPIGNSQSIPAPLAEFSRTDHFGVGVGRLVACEAY